MPKGQVVLIVAKLCIVVYVKLYLLVNLMILGYIRQNVTKTITFMMKAVVTFISYSTSMWLKETCFISVYS